MTQQHDPLFEFDRRERADERTAAEQARIDALLAAADALAAATDGDTCASS